MHTPHPPRVVLDGLEADEIRDVVRLALLVVADIAAEREWAAFEKVEFLNMRAEKKIAFWSLLDSSQRRLLKDMKART